MVGELERLESAARDFDLFADDDFVDPARLAVVVNALQGKLCKVLHRSRMRGDHLLAGQGVVSWAPRPCKVWGNVAADRLCVGAQLEEMPRVAEALSSGEIGYQAASTICHLQERVGQIGARIDEEMWIRNAKDFSIKDLREIATKTWHAVNPEDFCAAVEENFERRQLFISETDGMYRLDGWLEADGGAAVKTAIDALAKRLGAADDRSNKQRRADALVEIAHHAMNQATLPRRNGARPHITVTTTIEGLKGELGAAASDLQSGGPVANKDLRRAGCDPTLHPVREGRSVGVGFPPAARAAAPAEWRGR